jgi:hypothetical protein
MDTDISGIIYLHLGLENIHMVIAQEILIINLDYKKNKAA